MERSSGLMKTLVAAVERASDVVLITQAEPVDSPGPRILYVNNAFARMTGYSRDEVIGRTPRMLQGPESDRAALDRIRVALKSWKPVREELINYRKDGSKFWVELSIFPLVNENGWYTHWVGVQRETTEQNAIRGKLLESQNRLRTLTESIPSLLWTADARGKCEYVSASCADYLGVPPEACTGDGWGAFIHPEDRVRTFELWNKAVANGSAFVTEYRLRRRDGQYVWFLHRAQPLLRADGRVREWIGTSTDIAIQKRAEESLRLAEKLAVASQLASAISHEINSPLESLTNLLYLMETDPSEGSAREYLHLAQEQVARLSEVATHALRFHRQSTRPTARRLAETLDTLLNLSRQRIEAKLIVVRREYEPDAVLECRIGEMRQALGNLVSNSVEALAPRGLLWVKVRRAIEWSGRRREGVMVTIADTGAGIAPADLPRIFDPFFTTKGAASSGLGLWLTRDIVDRHQGRIWVRSSQRPGRTGTAMVLFFPCESPVDLA